DRVFCGQTRESWVVSGSRIPHQRSGFPHQSEAKPRCGGIMNERSSPAPSPGRRVEIIGVPLDLGQSERGTDVGPAAIRYAGLRERLSAQGHQVRDVGNLQVPPAAVVSEGERTRIIAEVNQQLYECARASHSGGALPLVLGGDHSV